MAPKVENIVEEYHQTVLQPWCLPLYMGALVGGAQQGLQKHASLAYVSTGGGFAQAQCDERGRVEERAIGLSTGQGYMAGQGTHSRDTEDGC